MSATVQRLNWEGKDAQDRRPHTREDHVRRDLEDDIGHEEKQQADGVLRRGEREVLLHPADLRVPDVRAVEVGERVQDPDGGDLRKNRKTVSGRSTVIEKQLTIRLSILRTSAFSSAESRTYVKFAAGSSSCHTCSD